jgi:beta-N-acetylhexosaminidase
MKPESMTIEQLAGQRLMAGFDGTTFNPDLEFLVRDLNVGGIILFSCNVASPDQIRDLTAAAQDCARSCGQPPLLVAVDQEGGPVARLRAPFTEFGGNPSMGGVADAEAFGRIVAAELSGVGINMNMAPVLDLSPPGMDSVMAERAFGADPHRVARLGTVVIEALQRGGVMAVAKHFPGIGRTTLDSHLDLPVLATDADTLVATDLLPFRAAVAAGVAGTMLSHVRYTGLDPRWPASLSKRIAKDLLRRQMGYAGVVMSDDLDMGAIARHFDPATAAEKIMAADVDLALVCHEGPARETVFDTFCRGLANDAGRKARGIESAKRILGLKEQYGIGELRIVD